MHFQQSRIYIVVVTCAFLSWLVVSVFEKEDETVGVLVENSIDYFSVGYSKTEMDGEGFPKSYLVADNMSHYSGDGSTHLDKPVMTLYNASVSPWIIQSETAVLMADGENLLLNGKVYIRREAAEGIKALSVDTSNLKVNLPTNYAETDQWTKIISPPNRTTGTGMKVTFVEPVHLKLLSGVKGRYEVK